MQRARQFKSDPDWMSLKEAVFIIKGYDEGEPNLVDRQVDSERYPIARRKLFVKACEAIGRDVHVPSRMSYGRDFDRSWDAKCYDCGTQGGYMWCVRGIRESAPHEWREVWLCLKCSNHRSLPIETEYDGPSALAQCGQLTPRQQAKKRYFA